MSSSYNLEEANLRNIIYQNVTTTNTTARIKLRIYYKNRKDHILFIKNNSHKYDPYTVVYQYSCDKEPCNGAQHNIGCTITTLGIRMRKHTSIQSHHRQVHNSKVTSTNIMQNTVFLRRTNNKQDLFIAEALLKKLLSIPKMTFLREH